MTLVEGGTALIPDAPTERGRRHIETLIEARRKGEEAMVLFVVQRPDASAFAPNVTAALPLPERFAGRAGRG